MTYEDFSKEILRWQGIFDGYPENDESYKLYFELISDYIKDIFVLKMCLRAHHDKKNKLFPKPFELCEYAPRQLEGLDKLQREVIEIKEKFKKEMGL